MRIEHRCAGLLEVKLTDADTGTKGEFSGYGAVFGNTDAYGDVIKRGAFKTSLREWKAEDRWPPMLLQHGGGFFGGAADDLTPVGVWTHMEETDKGLKVEGKLIGLGTDRGQYILEGLKEGALDGLSIGFMIKQAITGTKPTEPRRTITEIDLREVSIVTFPANGKARVSSVKSVTVEEMREWETALRDGGLSRKDCRIAVSVFKSLLQRDAGVPTDLARDEQDPADQTATIGDVQRALEKLRAEMRAGTPRIRS